MHSCGLLRCTLQEAATNIGAAFGAEGDEDGEDEKDEKDDEDDEHDHDLY